MSSEDSGLARRKLVQAFHLNGTLALFATGEVPVSNYEVRIRRLLSGAPEPQFALQQRRLPGIGSHAATPYAVSRLFAVGAYVQNVIVVHAGGQELVRVEPVHPTSAPAGNAVARGDLPVPYLFPPSAIAHAGDAHSATGYSDSFDLREAMQEAIAALPRRGDRYVEDLVSISVVEIGAEVGGIAGFKHLFVKVRRG